MTQIFAGQGNLLVGQGRVEAQDDDVGAGGGAFRVVDPQPCPPEGLGQAGRADDKEGVIRMQPLHLLDDDLGRQEHLILCRGNPHAGQLVQVVLLMLGGIVGKKAIAPSGLLQPLQEGLRERKEAVAQVDGPVHVQHEAADLLQTTDILLLFPLKIGFLYMASRGLCSLRKLRYFRMFCR